MMLCVVVGGLLCVAVGMPVLLHDVCVRVLCGWLAGGGVCERAVNGLLCELR